MENWLVTSQHQTDGRLEPEQEPEVGPQKAPVDAGSSSKARGATRGGGETATSPLNLRVEMVEAHPRNQRPEEIPSTGGLGWFARWRCCTTSATSRETSDAELQNVASTIPEGVPPTK